ncbi:MAG: molybdopterin-dependent oxidoreductase [Desulfobacterales bacterium]
MKIDRRCFLSFVIGGAIGTTLTPIPWKLTDDIAIWTQNWPWTPVPKDGASKYEKTVCAMCPGGCGISVRTIKDRALKVEGLSEHPVNRGSICPVGISALQYLYGPSRIQAPMKRSGQRGEGKWEQISWDEAIETVFSRLNELRERKKPETVACITDSDRGTVGYLLDRFLAAYGSPNFIRTQCQTDADELALYFTQGRQGTLGWDLENADFVLSFGYPLMDSPGSAGRRFSSNAGSGKKIKLVQIEARLSDTALYADTWIPAKPGTQGVLALGIAHVMVRDRLYDRDFVENFSFGFEDWTDDDGNEHRGFKTLLKGYSPDSVAELTGLEREKIESIARDFAKARRPVAISGRAEVSGSVDEALAIQALNALAGRINKKGGMVAVPEADYLSWSEMQRDETASTGRQQPRVDGAGTEQFPNARHLLHRVPEAINSAGDDSPIQALMVAGGNPLYTMPDTEAAKKAFDKIPFIVSFSTYMDETAAYSDLLLPNHHFLERFEDVPTAKGSAKPVIGLNKPVVKPQYDTLHTGDAVIRIAKKLGGFIKDAFPWKDYEEFLQQTLSDHWKTLEKDAFWVDEDFSLAQLKNSFNTPSGKYEFSPQARQMPPGSRDEAIPECSPVDLPGDAGELPLLLMPYASMRIAGQAVANPPFMTKTVDDTVIKDNKVFVEINPKTAKEHGFSEGDAAVLKTPAAEARVRVHLYEGIMPGLVALPAGLGHSAFSDYISGKGVNTHKLIPGVSDPASGLNTGWGSRASLSRI